MKKLQMVMVNLKEAVRKELRAMFSTREEIEKAEQLSDLQAALESYTRASELCNQSFETLLKLHGKTVAQRDSLCDALEGAIDMIREARLAWDADDDIRVGKRLIALSGISKGYDKRSDALFDALAMAKERA